MSEIVVDPAGRLGPSPVGQPTTVRSAPPRPAGLFVGPNLTDPRLHVSMVVLTLHVLGQTSLHFAVSIPQIVAAIAAPAAIELGRGFREHRRWIWPASAILTGSGVALILRIPDMHPDHHLETRWWYVYALVGAGSLVTKYLFRDGDGPWFNPSNLGLVVVFVLLGSSRVEPLDFWWGPFGPALALAYQAILLGGLLIVGRLNLLRLTLATWLTLTAGMGILAINGHCFSARWSLSPVCDGDAFRTVVFSPETLVFVLLMVTDPRTVPRTDRGRVVFGIGVGATAALLIAPATTEFGAKLGLLAGLTLGTLVLAVHRLLTRRGRSFPSGVRALSGARGTGRWKAAMAAVVAVGLWSVALMVAGAPARTLPVIDVAALPPVDDLVPERAPEDLPPASVAPDALDYVADRVPGGDVIHLVAQLHRNLDIEAAALEAGRPGLLPAADHGARLLEMQSLAGPEATSPFSGYRFTSLELVIVPSTTQSAARPAFLAEGTLPGPTGAGDAATPEPVPFTGTFVLVEASGDRWLLAEVQLY